MKFRTLMGIAVLIVGATFAHADQSPEILEYYNFQDKWPTLEKGSVVQMEASLFWSEHSKSVSVFSPAAAFHPGAAVNPFIFPMSLGEAAEEQKRALRANCNFPVVPCHVWLTIRKDDNSGIMITSIAMPSPFNWLDAVEKHLAIP